MQISEKWLRSWIDPPLDTVELAELLTMAGLEVEEIQKPLAQRGVDAISDDDSIFILKITPNRADCLSTKGLAREISALTGRRCQSPVIKPATIQHEAIYPIQIDAPQACGRYVSRLIKGIKQPPTPDWIGERLQKGGITPVSVITDITRYVMLELGQPLHAFDLSTMEGAIHVRMAHNGESLHAQNNQKISLNNTMLVIADEKKVLSLAGVMGGMDSRVTESTEDIWLESAFFDPKAISQKARQLGLNSEVAYRFERGVDSELQCDAIERATSLIVDICGGRVGPLVEQTGDIEPLHSIALRSDRITKLLGVAIDHKAIASILSRLNLPFEQQDSIFYVTVPSFRFDLNIEEDLIEEIARLYGYDHIPICHAKTSLCMTPPPKLCRTDQEMRCLIMARDYQEVINYAFIEEALDRDFSINPCAVKLLNPIDSQKDVMRSTLLGGLVKTLVDNYHRQQRRVRIFEIANTFRKTDQGDDYQKTMALLAWGNRLHEQWGVKAEPVDFYDIKSDIETLIAPRQAEFAVSSHPAFHPTRSADIVAEGVVVGVVGEMAPRLVHQFDLPSAPVMAEIDFVWLSQSLPKSAKILSKFLPVERDLALLVSEACPAKQLLDAMLSAAPEIVSHITLFDIYTGQGVPAGKKSMAYRVTLQSMNKTLTEQEINKAMAAVLDGAVAQGASLRV